MSDNSFKMPVILRIVAEHCPLPGSNIQAWLEFMAVSCKHPKQFIASVHVLMSTDALRNANTDIQGLVANAKA